MARALTLIEPWGWAIANAGKRHEHRSWAPWSSIVGKRIAIHAGKSFDAQAAEMIEREIGIVVPRDTPRGIVAVARVLGWVDRDPGLRSISFSFSSDGVAATHKAHESSDQRWYGGGIAWVLDDVWTLPEPVSCRGAQGLWTIPSDVLDRVNSQMQAAGREALR